MTGQFAGQQQMHSRSDVIAFHSPDSANGWLSTFSAHPIEIDGETYGTVEHYYQTAKFESTEFRKLIRKAE